jgi:RNA polymerase sigma factor (sigma-70 family)
MFESTQGSPQSRPTQTPRQTATRLSPEASQFYADVYLAARAGCCRALQNAGCSEEEAEEIFMATCEKVMRSVDPIARAFDPPQMVALLKVSSKRTLIDERRHQAVLSQVALDKASALVTDKTESTPEEIAEDRETMAIGREAMAELSGRDLRIFGLRHVLGLSPIEVRRQVQGLSSRAYRRRIERGNAKVLESFNRIEAGCRCREISSREMQRHIRGGTPEGRAKAIELHLAHCCACRRRYLRLSRRIKLFPSTIDRSTGTA